MVKNNAFIHLFKTPGGFYFYDVNKNAIVKIEEQYYELLKNQGNVDGTSQITGNENEKYDNWVKKLTSNGFLSSKRSTEIIHPSNDFLESCLENNIAMLILQVTQQCNLRCEYCVYSGNYINRSHSNKRMDIEIALKGIDYLIEHSKSNKEIILAFYGGEPLLEFKMIRECIEYAKKKNEGKKLRINMTVNGTLLNDEVIEFFEKNDVRLFVSLDGPKGVQDKNRRFAVNNCGTFDVIMKNIEMIKEKFPQYFKKIMFNIVLDPENDFNCTNDFFINYETIKGLLTNTTLISDDYTNNSQKFNEDFLIKRNYEIFKLYLSKIGKFDNKYTSPLVGAHYSNMKLYMADNRKISVELNDKMHHSGPCIPGVNRLFIDINGDFYPCERVSEKSEVMRIGNIENGIDKERVRKLLNVGKVTEDSCKNCWATRFCSLCAVSADNLTDLSGNIKKLRCNSVRDYADNMMKDYCTLREYKHDFEEYYEMEINRV